MESLQPLYTLATRGSRSHRCATGPDLALLKLLYATIFRRIRRQDARWIECDLFDFESLFLRARTTCPNLCHLSNKPR